VEGGLYAWNTLVYQSGKPWQNPEAITFHQHLWLGLFLENAASGTDWLVNVLDRDGQLYHSKALANYLDGVHLTAAKWERRAAATSDPKLTAFALASERGSLAWVMNRTWNWLDWVEGRKPAPLSGQSVTLPVERNGAYRVELWDTGAGKVAATVRAEARDGRLTVALPAIETDIALKCFPQ
jgi:hypothetical protein